MKAEGEKMPLKWAVLWFSCLLPLLLLPAVVLGADGEAPLPQAWEYAAAMRAVAAKGKGRPGVVLHVGDSITYANPYGAWALHGEGHTPDDDAALKWMHAGANDDTDGWHLAAFDHPDGGRSYTACGGIRVDEMLAGGRQRMPPLKDLLDQYRPQAVVFMLGTNDASAGRPVEAYRRDVEASLDLMLGRGVVPILSTIPPHVHREALARSYNEALRELARQRHLPLIDFEREIRTRRPNDWDGTLLDKGDVHPTAARAGATPASAPTPESLRNSGYLLRGWLSVKKIAEVKRMVFDAPKATGMIVPDLPWFPKATLLPKPAGAVVRVTNVEELFKAADEAKPGVTILVADGIYRMPTYLDLHTDNITLRGESGDRSRVVLDGAESRHGELLGVTNCAGVTVADLTIRNVRTNGFKVNSDRLATRVTLHNCVLHNVWERGVKGVAVKASDRDRFRPSDCTIEYCLFYNDRPKRYADDPADTEANFQGNYVGGIDAMYARRWTIRDNVFAGIRGRTGEARGAVFLWQQAEDCVVERNVVLDCDSGVCLGNSFKPPDVPVHASRCVVRNNFVVRCPQQGITADFTRDCRIVHNTVYEPNSRFGRLIRLVHDNDGLLVANNLLGDKPVLVETQSRVEMRGNVVRGLAGLCVDVRDGDLHLKAGATGVIDAAEPVEGVSDDIDGGRRDGKPDVGADEFGAANANGRD
jgi:hypothetical protein